MRSEDDLRAAFAARAGDAPASERVLRAARVADPRHPDPRHPGRRRWLVPAMALAAVAAVAVPLGLAMSNSSTMSRRSGQAAEPAQGAASLGVCRPSDVLVTLRRDGDAVRLIITSHGPSCQLARVPNVQWPNGSTTYRSTGQNSDDGSADAAARGVLRAGTTATAIVRWQGCGPPAGQVVYVDWGNGPVKALADAPTPAASCSESPAAANPNLRVGPFSGLS